jgi:hypothetical protein
MYTRVIEGQSVAKPLLHNAWDQLGDELRKGEGFLGSTGGVDRLTHFISEFRFESEESARTLMVQPRAELWYEEIIAHTTELDIRDTSEVDILLPRGSGGVGFVQFITGKTTDRERMKATNRAMQDILRAERPEVLGATIAWHPDDRFTETVYFTSERDARAGESREFPGGVTGLFGQLMQLLSEVAFVDLRDPWLI